MRNTILFWMICSAIIANAQISETPYQVKQSDSDWVKMLYSENPNLFELRNLFELWRKQNPEVKSRDTQYYKRFMRDAMQRISEDGTAGVIIDERKTAVLDNNGNRNANWQEAGPWHYDPEVAMAFQVQSPGACHVYTVEQSATNPETIWAGTATAGIWKSENKGMKWHLMSKNMLVNEVYSIAIDPNNNDVVYFGEGNGKIWRTESGGQTWSMTGDATFQNINHWVRDLRISPDNSQLIFAATNNGFYRSVDNAQNWTSIESGEFMEIEFHPTNSNIIYTVKRSGSSTQFLRSTDGGVSFTNITQGWPVIVGNDDQRRTEIAVTAASPNRVYALAAGEANGGSGLYGIYISNDAGLSWNFQCCGTGPAGIPAENTNPNILGWSGDGSEEGGQYYYDLAFGASPTNANRILGAGISVWRSLNAGQNWELNGHWVTWAGENTMERYTHADVHDIKFYETENGVDMWVASDGGIYYSSNQGDNIEPRMYGLHGTDFWGWQAGFKAGDVMAGGTYHNGTLIKNADLYHFGFSDEESGGWLAELAGDNFRGFINPGDPTVGYHDNGSFKFSEDRFTRISSLPFDSSKLPNTSYFYGEYGNLEWDPRCINHMYSPVESALWKTTDGGLTWQMLYDFGGSKIIQVKVSRTNPDIIYLTHRQSGSVWKIWRSTNQGQSWSDITPPLAATGNNGNKAKYIDVDGQDSNTLWVIVLGSDSNDNKILKSVNGGSTWTSITGSLSGEYLTYILNQNGTDGGVYAGTTKSVYYRDNNMSDWELFSDGLPASTPNVFLQADYCKGKIRSAGSRGVHEGDLYSPSAVVAGFMADALDLNIASSCDEQYIRFFDNSVVICEGANYEWSFPGGTPNVSNEMNPVILYDSPGEYDVILTVTDLEGGTSTITRENLITVYSEPFAGMPQEDFDGEVFPPEGWKLFDPEGNGAWERGTQPGNESNGVAQFPNYWVDATGQTDLLLFPALDFSNLQSPIITFDYSYRKYSTYNDGLALVYKTGSDPEWYTLFEKIGDELSVPDNYMWFWYDIGSPVLWINEEINLGSLVGESCVQLAFKNIGGYGNHIWVDNVNLGVSTDLSQLPQENNSLFLFPNPATQDVRLRVSHSLIGSEAHVYNNLGQIVATQIITASETIIPVNHLHTGIYSISVQNDKTVLSQRLIKSR